MSVQEQFLKDLDNDQNKAVDVMDMPLTDEPEKVEGEEVAVTTTEEKGEAKGADEDDGEGDALKPRNRRERRLMRKLSAERESSIFLAGKLEARDEARKAVTEESDYLKAVERIYGTQTPEAQLATDLLKKAIVGAREDAKRDAIAEMKAEREKEVAEDKRVQTELDDIVDDIEDTYDVNLTAAQEKSYFDLLKRMSSKDGEGRIVRLADSHAVFEIFQEKLKGKGTDNRAKHLSSRSMVQSGGSKESTLNDDASTRFLKEQGII